MVSLRTPYVAEENRMELCIKCLQTWNMYVKTLPKGIQSAQNSAPEIREKPMILLLTI